MNNKTETTTLSSEERLKELIKSIYYVTRHSDEIQSIKDKIARLTNILNSFGAEQSRKTVYNSLDASLSQLKQELVNETNEYGRQEQVAISNIKCILENEKQDIIKKAASKSGAVEDFKNFCNLIKQQVLKHGRVFQNELETTKKSLTGIRFDTSPILEDIIKVFKAEQEKLIAGLAEQTNEYISRRIEQMTSSIIAFNPQEFFKEHSNNGINQIKKINDDIEIQKKKALEVQDTQVPEHIVKFTKDFITQQLPSIKKRAIAEQEKQSEQQILQYESLKKNIDKSIDLVAQNKYILDSSRIWINTEKEQKLSNTPNVSNRDRNDMMVYMEDIEVEVADIVKSLDEKVTKMDQVIEDAVKEAVKEAEKGNRASFMPKKRQRPGDDDEPDNTQNGIDHRLNEFDTQFQQMDDFLSQFRDNVLDPMFPLRIESAMTKIERVLLNHETFISYLINPTSVSKDGQAGKTKSLQTSVLNDVINVIKKEQEELTSRLHKRIKALEDKLSAE